MATHALSTPASALLRAANDDIATPGKVPCRWRMAISTFRPMFPRLAVYFAKAKLRGADFDETCDELMRLLEGA